MMQQTISVRRVLLNAAVLATCVSIVVASSSSSSTSSNRERRRVGIEEPSHRPDGTHTLSSRSLKPSTSSNNEITTEPGRKVAHRLIAGHLRAEATSETDETLWDDGILLSSAGDGKETKSARKDEEDEKKTLSQQVKEGKYGLIQNEIYGDEQKRPGIVSYLGNPEVPSDTIDNLGGLDKDEIWLAENHVLVLRGGKFPGHESVQKDGDGDQAWPPIDDYKAPKRQVKIPSRPKVPPPFPIQLTEGGPLQIIGPNGTKEIGNGTVDYKKNPLFTKELFSEDGPLFAVKSNGTSLAYDSKNVTSDEEKVRPEEPLPPSNFPQFYHAIPPGAVFVPPPGNESDYDEEDQSIYYPPPYSFQYQQDNTTIVPPGPLVPGIILPPPPDFFAPLEDKKNTTKKYAKRPATTTSPPRPRPTYLPPRKLTTKQHKSTTSAPITKFRSSIRLTGNTKTYGRTSSYKNRTEATTPSVTTVPYIELTTPTPDKPTTLDNTPEFYNVGPLTGNQVTGHENVQEKKHAWTELVTSKTIPIVAYYATTTQSTLERPVEVTPASIKGIVATDAPSRPHSQASYYFYEESSEETGTGTTVNPSSSFYYKTTTESPFYETVTRPRPDEPRKQYYTVETVPSQETSKDYSIKFIGSLVKNSGPIGYGDSTITRTSSNYEANGSTRAQGQRMLPDHASLYYQTVSARPAAPVQPYYTTAKPQTYYRQDTKPKPIYQYSFEAADYPKRGNRPRSRYQQQPQPQPRPQPQPQPQREVDLYDDYRTVKLAKIDLHERRNEYQQDESTVGKHGNPESVPPYKPPRPVYTSTTTSHTVISSTPNPHHVYYTQQDEKFLDDVTREYFTMFGKKLPHKSLPSTTPIYSKSNSVTEQPDYNENDYNVAESPVYKTPNVKVHYGDQSQRPYSLKDDILVNYRQPLPPINPDSEFISVVDPRQQSANYRLPSRESQAFASIRAYPPEQPVNPRNGPPAKYVPIVESSPEDIDEPYPQLPISLADDIKVNYRDPRPAINPDAEFIDPIPRRGNHQRDKPPKAYFAYSLPGDSGHFYFLTPQAITQKPVQNADHLYEKSRGTRLFRRRRWPGNV